MSERKAVIYWHGLDQESKPIVVLADGTIIKLETLLENLCKALITKGVVNLKDLLE